MNVTVIIPIYNMELYLTKCLKSIFSQTLDELEILCIDDGSTDNSLEVLTKLKKKHPQLRILSQKNLGVGNTRNRGIQEARGKYLAFMDPDDYYPDNNVLKDLFNAAEKNNALICGGSFCKILNGKIQQRFEGEEKKYTFLQEGWLTYKDYQFDYGFHRFLYKKSFIVKNKLLFPTYIRFQDPPFFVKAMLSAEKFYALPRITYCYREKPNSINWNYERAVNLLKGLIDNLEFSKINNLNILHALTAKRLIIEFRDIWVINLSSQSSELLQLLLDAECLFDRDILRENNLETGIAPIIQSVLLVSGADENAKIFDIYQHKLDQVYSSWNYRIGAKILYLPKKIYSFLKTPQRFED